MTNWNRIARWADEAKSVDAREGVDTLLKADVLNQIERNILAEIRGENDNHPSRHLHSVSTGACLCTSFSQRLADDLCKECRHKTHNTRTFCGTIR